MTRARTPSVLAAMAMAAARVALDRFRSTSILTPQSQRAGRRDHNRGGRRGTGRTQGKMYVLALDGDFADAMDILRADGGSKQFTIQGHSWPTHSLSLRRALILALAHDSQRGQRH